MLTDNVRRDYFDGREGFINTGKWLGDLYFFIEVEGLRFYAVIISGNE